MRLTTVLSICVIAALAAPPSFAADAKPPDKPADKPPARPAGKPANKPAVPTVQKPLSFTWPIIKQWYEPGEDAKAIQAAKLLGRPIAIAWYVEGKPKGCVRRWKRSEVAKYFVCLSAVEKVTGTTKEGKLKYTIAHSVVKPIHKASGIGKVKAPCLFIATWDGKYLGVIKREVTDKNAINDAARKIVKDYGKLLRTTQAHNGWKNLRAARKLWHSGKYDAAMEHYRIVISVAKVNSSMAIAAELNKDAVAIDHRGAEQLKVAGDQLRKGELYKAEDTVRKIHYAYNGFETAKDAKALFESIRTARKERAIAAKGIKKDAVTEPPTKPAAGDKPAANDEKKDDVHDDKKDDGDDNKKGDDEDGGYEEDF